MGKRFIAVVGGSGQRAFGWTISSSPYSLGTSNEGVAASYDLTVYANIPEGTTAVWALRNPPAGITIDSAGILTKAAEVTQTSVLSIEVSLSQSTQGYGEVHRTFILAVNGAPVWASNTPTSITVMSGVPYVFGVYASDPEGDNITFSLKDPLPNYSIDPVTGAITATATTTNPPEPPPVLEYYGSGYDRVGYSKNETNGWRSQADTMDGWDWSFPPGRVLPTLSGMFQFGNVVYPTSFTGRKVKKIDADWGSTTTGRNVIEPSEGNFTLDWIADEIAAADFVEIDVRQTCRSYDSSASGAKGRQTTPTWLQAKLPTGGKAVTAATKATPCRVTIPGHGFSNGQEVFFWGVGGMTQLNSTSGSTGFIVTVVDTNNITIGVNSSGYDTYTSGGTAYTKNTHWTTDAYGQTTYLPWHATYQIYSKRMIDALRGEPCASYPVTPTNPDGGFRVDGHRLFDHPKVKFIMLHGLGGNSEEFTGIAADLVKDNQSLANAYLDFLQTNWFDKVGLDNIKKMSFVGTTRPWYRLIRPVILKGAGTRGGLVERWLGWDFTPQYSSATEDDPIMGEGGPLGTILEAYRNQQGLVQTGDPYPCYLDIDWTHPLRDQAFAPRHRQEQNEEYVFSQLNLDKITPDPVTGIAMLSPPVRWQQNYRYSMLRTMTHGMNQVAVENPTTGVNAYGGNENFVNPALMKWVARNIGYSVSETPEAWCALIRTYAYSANPLTNDRNDRLEINNLEYLLKQRETYGTTTPTLRRGHGIDPTDPEWVPLIDQEPYGRAVDTISGYPLYRWTPAIQGNANLPNSWWHIYLARQGAQIGFALDNRMNMGSSVAVKVTYYGSSAGTMTLRYSRSDGFTGIATHGYSLTNAVKTRTFFITDFLNSDEMNFRVDTTVPIPIMFVRVIKV